MSEHYVFFIYPDNWQPGDDYTSQVITGEQAMLDKVVELTKKSVKFAVFEVGKCLGDYS